MSKFQVLDSETRGGYINGNQLTEIIKRIEEEGGVENLVRYSTCRGYISRKGRIAYICSYSGRFGTGITIRVSSPKSTTYCDKQYITYNNISKERITEIIKEVKEKPHA